MQTCVMNILMCLVANIHFHMLYKEVLFNAASKLQLKENHDEDSSILLYDSLCLCSGYVRYVSSCSINLCSFIGTKSYHSDHYG